MPLVNVIEKLVDVVCIDRYVIVVNVHVMESLLLTLLIEKWENNQHKSIIRDQAGEREMIIKIRTSTIYDDKILVRWQSVVLIVNVCEQKQKGNIMLLIQQNKV